MSQDIRVGIDVVAVERVKKGLAGNPSQYIARFLTPAEASYCRQGESAYRPQSVAGRIAAKEAVMKVLGDGWPRVPWADIEILPGQDGRPGVTLYKKASDLASSLGMESMDMSITHDGGIAVAAAVAAFKKER